MTAPASDFETVPVGTLAKMERMREALEYAEKDFAAVLEWLLHPKTSLRDRIDHAERVVRPARYKLKKLLAEDTP